MAKSEDWSVIVEIDTRPNGLPGFRIVSKGGKSGVYSGTKDVFVASRFVPIGGQDTIPVESNRSESNPSSSEAIVRDLLMIDGVATDWLRLSHNYDDCWLIVWVGHHFEETLAVGFELLGFGRSPLDGVWGLLDCVLCRGFEPIPCARACWSQIATRA